ncbi:hypothetical protein BDQ12DRAFT_673732 [Crucibulum laeve]|uniref:Uncharacterized protein n=1 Tax=Crucibulum laeve TaxID=68775 RepID=A0A5C3MJL5_9AGAR|nr:hypothetical protein BDQ12DRAFT_673732 [Crucibulum laeve]
MISWISIYISRTNFTSRLYFLPCWFIGYLSKMLPYFPLTELTTELALEIIRLAATPAPDENLHRRRGYYSTALSLCSVSSTIRRATMPYLLHTIILSSSSDVLSFIDSLRLQKQHMFHGSRLAVQYSHFVRRFWSTECWEPLVDSHAHDMLDYTTLYDVIRGVESLGLNFLSLHLLYNGLSAPLSNPREDWFCRRVTLAGLFWRWKPLTSTSEGLAFLRQITHLNLWIPDHQIDPLSPNRSPIPRWVEQVPFALMPNLIHFSCPLLTNQKLQLGHNPYYTPTEVIVYAVDLSCTLDHDPTVFLQWASAPDPLAYGVVLPFRTPILPPDCAHEDWRWEVAYLQGQEDRMLQG